MRVLKFLSASAPLGPTPLWDKSRVVRPERSLRALIPFVSDLVGNLIAAEALRLKHSRRIEKSHPDRLRLVRAVRPSSASRAVKPDRVEGQVEAGERGKALQRLRPVGPELFQDRARLMSVARPFSACAPLSPICSGTGRDW